MPDFTPNLHLAKPIVDGDDDVWGDLLNTNADILDNIIHTIDTRPTGSGILSGTAPPDAMLGDEGEYYVDTDSNVMYGPKQGAWAAAEYVIRNNPPNLVGGGHYRAGLEVRFKVAVQIVGGRFWRMPTDPTLSRTMLLWDATRSVILATSLPTTEGAGSTGWVAFTFDPPFNASATTYAVTVDLDGYGYETNPVVFDPTHVVWVSGYYGVFGGPGFPTGIDGTNNYGLDIHYRPPSTGAWPIAVDGNAAPQEVVIAAAAPPQPCEIWVDTSTTALAGGPWIQLTRAAYDALSPPDPNTLYIVVG